MNRTVLATLCLVFSVIGNDATADWEKVYNSDKLVAFADPATMRRKGNIVKIWSLFDFKAENTYSDGSIYMSVMRETEFNCKDNLQRMVSYSVHSGKMGKGRLVDSGASPQDWKTVSRANIALNMKTFACENE